MIIDQIDQISEEFREWSFTSISVEAELQFEIGIVLGKMGHKFLREYVLNARSRIDFYLPDHKIGIEVKVAGGVNQVMRQIHRYNACDPIDGVILVTNRIRHTTISEELNHRPVRVVFIGDIR